MTIWYHHFWHAIVLSGIIVLAMLPGAAGALFAKLVARYTNFKFAETCVHFYVKTAQWIGSVALVLLVVGVVGRFGIFTLEHWREIWGP